MDSAGAAVGFVAVGRPILVGGGKHGIAANTWLGGRWSVGRVDGRRVWRRCSSRSRAAPSFWFKASAASRSQQQQRYSIRIPQVAGRGSAAGGTHQRLWQRWSPTRAVEWLRGLGAPEHGFRAAHGDVAPGRQRGYDILFGMLIGMVLVSVTWAVRNWLRYRQRPRQPRVTRPPSLRVPLRLDRALRRLLLRWTYVWEAIGWRLGSSPPRTASLPPARRWFAEVTDLYEHVIRDTTLSIEQTRRIFTLLSAGEAVQTAAEARTSGAAATAIPPPAPWSETEGAVRALRSAVSTPVMPASVRAAAAQLLLPHLPRLDTVLLSPPSKSPDSAAHRRGPGAVALLFSPSMLPSIALGAALVATACGARVCLVDDLHDSLHRRYASFLQAAHVHPYIPLGHAAYLFDRFHLTLVRSPLAAAPTPLWHLLRSEQTPEGCLGEALAPLLNAYDFDAVVLSPGQQPASMQELESTAQAVAFFRPTKAWLIACQVDGDAAHWMGCLLPGGNNWVREIVYTGRQQNGEDVASVEPVQVLPRKYRISEHGGLEQLIGSDAEGNARLLQAALRGDEGDGRAFGTPAHPTPSSSSMSRDDVAALRDAIILNAAALLMASQLAGTLHEGVQAAREVLTAPTVPPVFGSAARCNPALLLWEEWRAAT